MGNGIAHSSQWHNLCRIAKLTAILRQCADECTVHFVFVREDVRAEGVVVGAVVVVVSVVVVVVVVAVSAGVDGEVGARSARR